ncbi:MAG TPA: hydrogenase maturation nickel metallochaperone HypA [Chloroflexota bacterium]|nr:hydrogenase maturation nickel metallochaperone HypA [Chloroflexota bacterium]
MLTREVGLISDALQQAQIAAQEVGAQRIDRLTLVLAERSPITPELVATTFGVLSQDTIAEEAELWIRRRGDRRYCWHCDLTYPVSADAQTCPECGGAGTVEVDHRELVLEAVDFVDDVPSWRDSGRSASLPQKSSAFRLFI